MSTSTQNYGLIKPQSNEYYDIGIPNGNMDKIDAALAALEAGKASLGADGKVPAGQLPEMDYDPSGSAAAVQTALTSHTSNKANPHGVTAAQVGAVPTSRTVNGKALSANISLTAANVGADPAGTASSAVSAHNQDGSAHPALQAKLESLKTAVTATYPVAAGQTIQAGDVVDVADGEIIGIRKSLSAFSVGDIVQLNENGSPVNYIVVNQGKPGNSSLYDNSCDGTWLLRQDAYNTSYRWDNGNSNVLPGADIFTTMADMLSVYDVDVQAAIKTVKIPYCVGGGSPTVKSGSNGLSCKIFPLGGYEVGFTTSVDLYFPIDGAKLDYFEPGIGSSAKNKRIATREGTTEDVRWWLRSPSTNTLAISRAWYVNYDGTSLDENANYYNYLRPALVLPFDFIVEVDASPSTAIALQSGTAGQSIDIIYSGITDASFITQGQTIASGGVYGAGVLDGVLQVWSNDRPKGLQIETGSYKGTGTYGSSKPNSITFSFVPKIVFIGCNWHQDGAQKGIQYTSALFYAYGLTDTYRANGYEAGFATSDNGTRNASSFNYAKLVGSTLSWYYTGTSSQDTSQMNSSNTSAPYQYLAIG